MLAISLLSLPSPLPSPSFPHFPSLPPFSLLLLQLSIQYSRIEERLGVGLVQVKAQALEGHNEAAIFISVQLIPDDR